MDTNTNNILCTITHFSKYLIVILSIKKNELLKKKWYLKSYR